MILAAGAGCKANKPVSEEAAQSDTKKADAAQDSAKKADAVQDASNKVNAALDAVNKVDAVYDAANKVNAALDAADKANNGEALGAENTAPGAASIKCEKWGTNPLFADGHEFVYDITESHKACCNLDEDDPKWECDKDGDCTKESTVKLKCKISVIQAESVFCASKMTCLDSNGKEADITNVYAEFGYSLAGYWVIDSNGLYHFAASDKLNLDKQASPGDCKKTKYILCNPETLAYEYAGFSNAEPLISFVKYKEMDTDSDDENFSSSRTITHKQSTWERKDEVSGPDEFSQSVTFDEKHGITEFKTHFAGGSESDTIVKLQ